MERRWAKQSLLGLCALALSLAMARCGTAQPAAVGSWTGVLNWPLEAIHAVMLPTGKVMVWQSWTESVALWDPVSGQFSSVQGQPSVNPFCAGHAWLADGRLLVVGGHEENYNGEEEANIYNPFTNSWDSYDANPNPFIQNWVSNVPDMNATNGISDSTAGRWYPSATTLGNGDVLTLAGDMLVQGVTNPLPQIYEAATNSWRDLTTAIKTNLPEYPRTFLAPDGRVAVMSDYSDDTYLLDTTGTGSWTYVDHTLDGNLHNYGPAVMYDTGKIAYLGGGHNPTFMIQLLDLNEENPQWRYSGGFVQRPPAPVAPYTMAQPRRQNDATILADGTVLITGGSSIADWNDPDGLVAVAEIWDPETEIVKQVAAASDTIFRGYHSTATLLPDGRVLIAGGNHDEGGYTENRNAEIYSPPYLFAPDGSPAARPLITSAPETGALGNSIFVETPDAAQIAKALIIVPGATTHAQNWTQRANVLDVALSEGGLEIALPPDGNHAPPGYYMLFLVNDAGVPSVAEWLRLELPTIAPLLIGDYNEDGAVNAADYVVWRNHQGTDFTLANRDPTQSGEVGPGDYEAWLENFGNTTPGGAGTAAVPEPAGLVLILIALAPAILNRAGRAEVRTG